MRVTIILIIFFLFNFSILNSQENKKDKKVSIIPMPASAYTPSTGFLFGVAPGACWYMGDKNDTRISFRFKSYDK